MPEKELDNQRVLELTADIVMTAMRLGRLDSGNAEAVAHYYDVVSTQILEAAYIGLPELTARRMSKREVQPH